MAYWGSTTHFGSYNGRADTVTSEEPELSRTPVPLDNIIFMSQEHHYLWPTHWVAVVINSETDLHTQAKDIDPFISKKNIRQGR